MSYRTLITISSVAAGLLLIQAGRAADSSTLSAQDRRFILDHTNSNQELMALAQRKGVPLPSDSPSPSTILSSKTGDAFDHEFARIAVDDHQKDIAEFEREANFGSDPEVKAWASRTLATLNTHLDSAKALPSF